MAKGEDEGPATPMEEAAELLKAVKTEVADLDKMTSSTAKTIEEAGDSKVEAAGHAYIRAAVEDRLSQNGESPMAGVYEALLDILPAPAKKRG